MFCKLLYCPHSTSPETFSGSNKKSDYCSTKALLNFFLEFSEQNYIWRRRRGVMAWCGKIAQTTVCISDWNDWKICCSSSVICSIVVSWKKVDGLEFTFTCLELVSMHIHMKCIHFVRWQQLMRKCSMVWIQGVEHE